MGAPPPQNLLPPVAGARLSDPQWPPAAGGSNPNPRQNPPIRIPVYATE